jgi:hypothetical protein
MSESALVDKVLGELKLGSAVAERTVNTTDIIPRPDLAVEMEIEAASDLHAKQQALDAAIAAEPRPAPAPQEVEAPPAHSLTPDLSDVSDEELAAIEHGLAIRDAAYSGSETPDYTLALQNDAGPDPDEQRRTTVKWLNRPPAPEAATSEIQRWASEFRATYQRWKVKDHEINEMFRVAKRHIKLRQRGYPEDYDELSDAEKVTVGNLVRKRRSREKHRTPPRPKLPRAVPAISAVADPKAEIRDRYQRLTAWLKTNHHAARKLRGAAREIIREWLWFHQCRAELGRDPTPSEFERLLNDEGLFHIDRFMARTRMDRLRKLEQPGYAWGPSSA